jgi:hypothetical protein
MGVADVFWSLMEISSSKDLPNLRKMDHNDRVPIGMFGAIPSRMAPREEGLNALIGAGRAAARAYPGTDIRDDRAKFDMVS